MPSAHLCLLLILDRKGCDKSDKQNVFLNVHDSKEVCYTFLPWDIVDNLYW
jgi:hypothetical protein